MSVRDYFANGSSPLIVACRIGSLVHCLFQEHDDFFAEFASLFFCSMLSGRRKTHVGAGPLNFFLFTLRREHE